MEVIPDDLVVGAVVETIPGGILFDAFLEFRQLVQIFIQTGVSFEVVLPHVDQLQTYLGVELLDHFQGLLFHETDLVQLLLELLGVELAVVLLSVYAALLFSPQSQISNLAQQFA